MLPRSLLIPALVLTVPPRSYTGPHPPASVSAQPLATATASSTPPTLTGASESAVFLLPYPSARAGDLVIDAPAVRDALAAALAPTVSALTPAARAALRTAGGAALAAIQSQTETQTEGETSRSAGVETADRVPAAVAALLGTLAP